MAGAVAMETLRTGLSAALAIEARRAGWWVAHTKHIELFMIDTHEGVVYLPENVPAVFMCCCCLCYGVVWLVSVPSWIISPHTVVATTSPLSS